MCPPLENHVLQRQPSYELLPKSTKLNLLPPYKLHDRLKQADLVRSMSSLPYESYKLIMWIKMHLGSSTQNAMRAHMPQTDFIKNYFAQCASS